MGERRLAAPALLNRLEQLYHPPAPISSPKVHTIKAAVLDTPIQYSTSDAEDVVYIAQAVLERLCPTCCTLVDLINPQAANSTGHGKRTVRVRLLPVQDPPVPGSITAVALPPMVAHNLGLTYQVQPFMTAGAVGNNNHDKNNKQQLSGHQQQRNNHTPALHLLQLRPVVEDSHSTTTVSATNGPKDHSSSRSIRVAQSVTICKVAQPVVTPLGAAGSSSRGSSSAGDRQQQGVDRAAAAGGAQAAEIAQQGDLGSSSSSSSESDELLQQLQKHFTRQRR